MPRRGREAFLAFCRSASPGDEADLAAFLDGALRYPLEPERVLQAYLFHHRELLVEPGSRVLLFEHALWGEATELGKCDLVFGEPSGRIVLVETKYLQPRPGRAGRRRRNAHRRKLRHQVEAWARLLEERWGLAPEELGLAVFTTDEAVAASLGPGVAAARVAPEELERWRLGRRALLRGGAA